MHAAIMRSERHLTLIAAMVSTTLASESTSSAPTYTTSYKWFTATSTGQVSVSASYGARVRCPEGLSCRIVTWGETSHDATPTSPVTSIASTQKAFAAVHADGSVTAWGSAAHGADVPESALLHSPVVSVTGAESSFASLHEDGSVRSWGHSSFGGSGAPISVSSPIVSILASRYAYNALHEDGSVTGWPSNYGGQGVPTSLSSPIVSLTASQQAFAALHQDGTVTSWGTAGGGGDYGAEGAPISPSSPIVSIAATDQAFAALHEDGSVTAWGHTTYGGGSGAPTSPDSPVVSIAAAKYAFAALHQDGSVTAWGRPGTQYGAEGAPNSPASPIVSVAGGESAFTALHADGSVTCWGSSIYGCDGVPDAVISPFVSIFAARQTFVGLHSDGTVTSWGHEDDSITSMTSPVVSFASTGYSLVALHSDTSVTTWGHSMYGGTGGPSNALAITGNQRSFTALLFNSIDCNPGSATSSAPATLDEAYDTALMLSMCTNCAPGHFQPLRAQQLCDTCQVGKYQEFPGSTACDPCEPGYFQPDPGQAACEPCAAGTFQPDSGQASPLSCLPCPPGTFQDEEGSSECMSCPTAATSLSGRDTYSFLGFTSCSDCPIGFDCSSGELLECDPGSYSIGTGGCQPCERGYRCPGAADKFMCGVGRRDAPELNFAECVRCAAGTYQSAEGATVCNACEQGHYCPEGAAAALPCGAGSYSSATDLSSASGCTNTNPGFFAPVGSSEPTPCRADTFNPKFGQFSDLSCEPCPFASTTRGATGQGSLTDCVCMAGYYNSAEDFNLVNCSTCPSGTKCDQAGFSLNNLPIKRGYYRLDNVSIDVRRCPDAASNCTNAPECPESTSGCRGTVQLQGQDSNSGRRLLALDTAMNMSISACHEGSTGGLCHLCHPNLTGVFCLKCDTEVNNGHVYYSAATNDAHATCKACGNTLSTSILAGLGVALVAALLLSAFPRLYRRSVTFEQRRQLSVFLDKVKPMNKLKLLVAFYMIATKVDSVYEVDLPPQVRQLLRYFSIAISLGLDVGGISTPLQCLGWTSFLHGLIFWTVMPIIVAALIFLAAMLLQRRSRRARLHPMQPGTSTQVAKKENQLIELALPSMLRLLFLCYPLVSNIAFEAWLCYKFDGSKAYLMADVDIECGTAAHEEIKRFAWFAVLLYPIGLLVLNGSLLFAARHAILTGMPTALSRSISFLHSEYEPHLCWWELMEQLRRLVLVGLMVLMRGNTMQLIVGTFIALVFLLFQVQMQPYKSMADDFLASCTSFSLVVILLCAYAFKHAAVFELSDIQDKMSVELLQTYVVNSTHLTIILMASVVGSLLVSALMFAILFTAETRRLSREARAAAARRLRLIEDNSEVVLDRLPPLKNYFPVLYSPDVKELPTAGPFHIFLSHNWKHGQSAMRIVKTRLLEMLPDASIFLDVDNLGGGADHTHLDVTCTCLCYCTQLWFTNMPCVREVVRAVLRGVPLIALLEPEPDHGGHSEAECREILHSKVFAEQLRNMEASVATWAKEWGMPSLTVPTSDEIEAALFAHPPIVWYRLGAFQDVSMRLIGERLMQHKVLLKSSSVLVVDRKYTQRTFMQGEVVEQLKSTPIQLPKLPQGCRFHLYCSRQVERARVVAVELQGMHPQLTWTENLEELEVCQHMLVLLNSQTWTSGQRSAAFAHEVAIAMRVGVHRLLVHEVPGARTADKALRHDCLFDELLNDAWTPKHLLLAGLYGEIAMNVAGDEWRPSGLAVTLQQLAKGSGPRENYQVYPLEEASDDIVTAAADHTPDSIPHDGLEPARADGTKLTRQYERLQPLGALQAKDASLVPGHPALEGRSHSPVSNTATPAASPRLNERQASHAAFEALSGHPPSLSERFSHTFTQWDSHDAIHLANITERNIEPGPNAGGGVRVLAMELWEPRELESLRVIKAAVHLWLLRRARSRPATGEAPLVVRNGTSSRWQGQRATARRVRLTRIAPRLDELK